MRRLVLPVISLSTTFLLFRPPLRDGSHGVFHVLVRIQRRIGIDDLAVRRDHIRSAVGVRRHEQRRIVCL